MAMIDTAVIGKKGGIARGKKLSKEELSAAGREAAQARWAKPRAKKKAGKKAETTRVANSARAI
jgi:hypothetical protein